MGGEGARRKGEAAFAFFCSYWWLIPVRNEKDELAALSVATGFAASKGVRISLFFNFFLPNQ